MEIWDAYFADGTPAGFDLVRDQPIPLGLYHLVSEILIRHKDGSYLLMQRDYRKKGNPGLFECSAGGSVLKGETPHQAALRELAEETGIHDAELMDVVTSTTSNTIFYAFLGITECDKSSIQCQDGETIAYQWVNEKQLQDFLKSNKAVRSQVARMKPYLQRSASGCQE